MLPKQAIENNPMSIECGMYSYMIYYAVPRDRRGVIYVCRDAVWLYQGFDIHKSLVADILWTKTNHKSNPLSRQVQNLSTVAVFTVENGRKQEFPWV